MKTVINEKIKFRKIFGKVFSKRCSRVTTSHPKDTINGSYSTGSADAG